MPMLLLLLLVSLTVRGSAVGAQERAPSLSAARVTAQVVGGTLVAPVAFIGGGVATKRLARRLGADDHRAGQAAYVGAYSATWLSTAAIPAVIGRDGKFPAALGGSALGMLASVGVVRLGNWRYDGDRHACDVLCWSLGALVVALPSIGATVLYDQSRR
ncbi:MAG: hypothetical protein ABI910_10150 [Gemmatimonadota bacterium]